MYTADKINLMNKGQKFVEQYMKRNHYVFNYYDEENRIAEYSKIAAGIVIESAHIVFTKNMRVKEVR